MTWEEDTNTAIYTNADTKYMCVIEPTGSRTFQVGDAVNTNFTYDPIYNAYVVDTTYKSNTVMPYAEAVNFLTKGCVFDRYRVQHGDEKRRYTTSSRKDRYICPTPTGTYEIPITLIDNTEYKTCSTLMIPSDVRENTWNTYEIFSGQF